MLPGMKPSVSFPINFVRKHKALETKSYRNMKLDMKPAAQQDVRHMWNNNIETKINTGS